jgi:hypothetical protein
MTCNFDYDTEQDLRDRIHALRVELTELRSLVVWLAEGRRGQPPPCWRKVRRRETERLQAEEV